MLRNVYLSVTLKIDTIKCNISDNCHIFNTRKRITQRNVANPVAFGKGGNETKIKWATYGECSLPVLITQATMK